MMDEYIFKVVLVGPHGAGKTSLARRLSGQAGKHDVSPPTPTIGTDFYSCVVEDVKPFGCNVRLQLWDTAGLEKYAASPATVYANSNACIAVADCTRAETLDEVLKKWLPSVTNVVPTLARECILILCNKADELPSGERAASERREARSRVDAAGFPLSIVADGSAVTGDKIDGALANLCKRLLETTDLPTTGLDASGTYSPPEAMVDDKSATESVSDKTGQPSVHTSTEIDLRVANAASAVDVVRSSADGLSLAELQSRDEAAQKAGTSKSFSPPGSPEEAKQVTKSKTAEALSVAKDAESPQVKTEQTEVKAEEKAAASEADSDDAKQSEQSNKPSPEMAPPASLATKKLPPKRRPNRPEDRDKGSRCRCC